MVRLTRALLAMLLVAACWATLASCSGSGDTGRDRAAADAGTGATSAEREGEQDPDAAGSADGHGHDDEGEGEGEGEGDDGHGHDHAEDAGTTDTTEVPQPWRAAPRGDLPEGFPDSVPLPEPRNVLAATHSTGEGPRSFVVQLTTPGTPAEVLEGLSAWFLLTGWDEVQRPGIDEAAATSSAVYTKGTVVANVGVIPGPQEGSTTVSYAVSDGEPIG